MPAPALILTLLLALSFSLGTYLQPRFQNRAGGRNQSDNVLAVLIGDSRRLFANHFFVKADVYFHSGYYPTIFDEGKLHESSPMRETLGGPEEKKTAEASHPEPDHDDHEAGE